MAVSSATPSTNVLEAEVGRIESSLSGADIVALRVAEDQGLRCDVEDRRLAEWKTVGRRTNARASNDVRNVCVTKLLNSGERLVDVGLGHQNFGAVFQARDRLPS